MGLRKLFMIILLTAALIGGGASVVQTPTDLPAGDQVPRPQAVYNVRLASVGDIMMHNTQITAGYVGGAYNFDHFFADISPYWADCDLVIGNLETTFAGKEQQYTGYPRFNSPDELAAALKKAGFDIVSTANNHANDRREQGVRRTLDVLDAHGLLATGTARSPEERAAFPIVEVEGIRMAFLAYTYSTNGIPVPASKEYLVNMIDETLMAADIASARAQGADLVIVSPHYGAEYRLSPNDYQLRTVDFLIRAGADVILGSHPHVLQPFGMVTATLADGSERQAAVLYSQGNFISAQKGLERETAAVFFLDIEKDLWTGITQVTAMEALPIYTHKYREGGVLRYRVVAIEPAMAKYRAGQTGRFSSSDFSILQSAWNHAVRVLGEENLLRWTDD